jgi:hypothetical protein
MGILTGKSLISHKKDDQVWGKARHVLVVRKFLALVINQ